MQLVTKKEIAAKEDGFVIKSLALLQSMERRLTKSGSPYYCGNLQMVGTIPYKVWNNSAAFNFMDTADKQSGIVEIDSTVNIYSGQLSLVISSIRWGSPEGLTEADFYESVYDSKKYMGMLRSQLQTKCSPEAVLVFELLMKKYEQRFVEEFAAISHHDNCRNGLLAHTVKVMKIANVLAMYKNLMEKITPDVLYVGCALHDIGKIIEYNCGTISETGKKVSHLTIGIEMLYEVKEEIVKLKGEDFYYDLCSIISQHAGEWSDRPRTVAAYVVNAVDSLEANFATLNTLATETGTIQLDGLKLN